MVAEPCVRRCCRGGACMVQRASPRCTGPQRCRTMPTTRSASRLDSQRWLVLQQLLRSSMAAARLDMTAAASGGSGDWQRQVNDVCARRGKRMAEKSHVARLCPTFGGQSAAVRAVWTITHGAESRVGAAAPYPWLPQRQWPAGGVTTNRARCPAHVPRPTAGQY